MEACEFRLPLCDTRGWPLKNIVIFQFAVEIVKSARQYGTKTPFLSKVLEGEDGFLHRPLTNSELAEECMGGM